MSVWRRLGPGLPVTETVKEAAEDAAFAGQGGAGYGRGGALAGDGLVVIGAGDGVDDLGLLEFLGAIDLGPSRRPQAHLELACLDPGEDLCA